MVIIFDLDDTLYEELSYVYGGFQAVAKYLSPSLGFSQRKIVADLKKELQVSRNEVFDRYLQAQSFFTKKRVKACLSLYRGHKPKIHLFPEAKACLRRLKNHPLYVVTDGNKIVQKRKFEALKLSQFIRRCFCTHAFGKHRQKPSTHCFELICRLEKVPPEKVVYVADNPHKDFVGLKKRGFQTIRVLKGPYRAVKVDKNYDADKIISSLKYL